jgi:hypothetical protein
MNLSPKVKNIPVALILLPAVAAALGLWSAFERNPIPADESAKPWTPTAIEDVSPAPLHESSEADAGDAAPPPPREEAVSNPGPAAAPAEVERREVADVESVPLQDAAPAAAQPEEPEVATVVVYYFHRTLRCPGCLSIENQAREAIELTYDGELAAGMLEWRAVNIEEPGNEHFEQDFELQTQSLVLAETAADGQVTRWKLLPKVWEFLEDPPAFQEYVIAEVAMFLQAP